MTSNAISGPKTIRCLHRLAAIAALALLPKCFACMAGYLAVLSGLTAVTPVICGAGETGFPGWQAYVFSGLTLFVVGGGVFRLISQKGGDVSGCGGAKR